MSDRWGARVVAVHVAAVLTSFPVEVTNTTISSGVGCECFLARPHERDAWRDHQALLAAGQGDVDAPLVHQELFAAHRRDAVDHE